MTSTHAQWPQRSARRGRRWKLLSLLDYQPDPDDLFLHPGHDVRAPRRPARHRASGPARHGISGRLFILVAVLVAVAAFFGGTALASSIVGSPGAGARAPRPVIPGQRRLPARASTSPLAVAPSSPSVSAMGGNRMTLSPAAVPSGTPTRQAAPALVMTTPSTAAPPTMAPTVAPGAITSGQETVAVRYAVDSRSDGGFQAEIDVVNDGAAPVSGWQIVVVLPQDQVTAVRNAEGYVSHHILLLHQVSSWSALAPGATLRVFLTITGPETAPELCAFDSTACG